MRYNHAFTVAFSLESDTQDGSDITPAMCRAALEARMNELDKHGEWDEAIGPSFDTYEVGDHRYAPKRA